MFFRNRSKNTEEAVHPELDKKIIRVTRYGLNIAKAYGEKFTTLFNIKIGDITFSFDMGSLTLIVYADGVEIVKYQEHRQVISWFKKSPVLEKVISDNLDEIEHKVVEYEKREENMKKAARAKREEKEREFNKKWGIE